MPATEKHNDLRRELRDIARACERDAADAVTAYAENDGAEAVVMRLVQALRRAAARVRELGVA